MDTDRWTYKMVDKYVRPDINIDDTENSYTFVI